MLKQWLMQLLMPQRKVEAVNKENEKAAYRLARVQAISILKSFAEGIAYQADIPLKRTAYDQIEAAVDLIIEAASHKAKL